MKKALKISALVLIVLMAVAFAIPFIFKRQIADLVKKEINRNLRARVDFSDVSLSLFRHFPKVSIRLEGLTIIGTDEFANDTLIAASAVDASANLISVIKGKDIKVSGVYLESPRIHALVNKEGKANWDITKGSASTTSPDSSTSEFKMTLQKYEIKDGYIFYKDETSDMSAEIAGLDHEGSGDFTQDEFILSTATKTKGATFTYAKIPYLANTIAVIDADIKIDNKTNTYTFKTDDIALNNLKVTVDGTFQLVDDSTYKMDISFKSPSNDFKDILSLVPAVYKNDFDKIKTSGSALFNGFIKGTYGPQQLPAYDINLEVKDGFFQYPDLPSPVKNIQIDLRLSNPDGIMDNTLLEISKGRLDMDNEPFDFKLLFKNPETIKYLEASAKGSLDLANISRFVKLEGNTKLAGLVQADVFAKGNLSALESQQGPFFAGGFLDIRNLSYSSKDFPQPVQNGSMKVQLENSGGSADNTTIKITDGHIELGKDPFDFALQLSNPVSSIDYFGSAKGRFTLDNIRQFTELEPGTIISGILNADLDFKGSKAAFDKQQYDKINIDGTASLSNLKYTSKDYPEGVAIENAQLTFNEKNVTLNKLNGSYLHTDFTANGIINNLVGYAMQNQVLSGNMNVTADKMDLNDWMGSTSADTISATTSTSPATFIVPKGINFMINAKASRVKYDKVNYDNIDGVLALNDETVKLENVRADALDGTVSFSGFYSTKANKKQPYIALSYNLKDINIQQAFFAFNTFQKLMPVGQFLDGKLNSQLVMTGNLDGNMMPNLSSLSGKGNFLLLEGVLKKFAPLEKLANTLQIEELNSISLKDIKNQIEFSNGKVLVKPFTVNVKDIEMQIGGTHGFDQSIDYVIAMKVPRKYLGTEGNNLVNNLASQASSKGIPVKLGDVVNLNVKMAGTITSPSIKTDLKEVAGDAVADLKQQAADFAKEKVDAEKQKIKDSANVVKNQVLQDVKEDLKGKLLGSKDSTQNTTNIDSTKKKAEQTIKNSLDGLFRKKKKTSS